MNKSDNLVYSLTNRYQLHIQNISLLFIIVNNFFLCCIYASNKCFSNNFPLSLFEVLHPMP